MQLERNNYKVETYTYPETDGKPPVEVLLIGSNPDVIGFENTFEPKGFFGEHISTWLRKRYYIHNGCVYAQVPRQTKRYPQQAKRQLDLKNSIASDVALSDDDTIEVYYPVSEKECACLFWNLSLDSWSMSYVNQPTKDGGVVADQGSMKNSELIWESPV